MINSISAAASTSTSTSTTSEATKELGKDDFLQLLITQLTHQDPTDPVSNEDFIAQMAQFSSLEQLTNISSGIENLTQMQMTGAVSFIGKTVTAYDSTSATNVSAVVNAVYFNDGEIILETDSGYLYMEDVLSVSA
ncbi:flagellar hook assembly protein FlgD [Aminithiophilus ramosus]|uniref:Flagellar hook assembly protein FlgD n=2 Tax=Synergistales TaxID=649776 RepID=A0A9Q7EYX9_9BACT|nr:flagellar hook capping FlgD N-terminal domain-containing protein [Aminithiophilus ramosus]QTX31662.1 flagellar hook assembly protein FlgD [Aminithiophilus ramosus]QVL35469.1 flagellar hook assembly protein FlgD [Synergistota bacterium]